MTALEIIDAEPTTALVPYEHVQPAEVTLFGQIGPDEVVRESTKHARALARVIEKQRLFKVIGQGRHILVEGWQTLGAMTGVFAVGEGEPEYVEIGGVGGFKATVTAVRNGQIIGRATAFCMRDEDLWRSRPTHALASMAQTRATSKALKGPLGFIVKLAGYEATPAEEMPSVPDPPPRAAPVRADQADLPEALQNDGDPERGALVGELLRVANLLGVFDATVAAITKYSGSHTHEEQIVWLTDQVKKAQAKLAVKQGDL